MTTTTTTTATDNPSTPRVPFLALLRTSLIAAAIAAAATEAFTAVVRAAGIHLAVGDPGGDASSVVPLHPGACTITIAMITVPGVALAALINRLASHPARLYAIVAGVLVLLSLAAPLTAGATSLGSKLTLAADHLIAAAVIIPLVVRRLSSSR